MCGEKMGFNKEPFFFFGRLLPENQIGNLIDKIALLVFKKGVCVCCFAIVQH
jgi:hypothetical protein